MLGRREGGRGGAVDRFGVGFWRRWSCLEEVVDVMWFGCTDGYFADTLGRPVAWEYPRCKIAICKAYINMVCIYQWGVNRYLVLPI